MLSDEASLIIGLIAHRLSQKKEDAIMTFGWGRVEVLGGLVNATFLLATRLMIILDAIHRLVRPEAIEEPAIFLLVAVVGLLVNVTGMLLFRNHGHSDNIRGVFLHVVGDFFGSVAVIASAATYYFTDWPGKVYLDPLFSIIIAVLLSPSSLALFKKTSAIVIEKCPECIRSEKVRQQLESLEGVISVKRLRIWTIAKGRHTALTHIVIASRQKSTDVLRAAEDVMKRAAIESSTVQIEFREDIAEDTNGASPIETTSGAELSD
jgi:cation diffusion facilitator family transporter